MKDERDNIRRSFPQWGECEWKKAAAETISDAAWGLVLWKDLLKKE
jgi:hypothetical protein